VYVSGITATSVMSKTRPETAVCDAGLKAQSVDSGLPKIFARGDVEYIKCSDERGVISDPNDALRLNDKLKLVQAFEGLAGEGLAGGERREVRPPRCARAVNINCDVVRGGRG
jgi:hypothetical protein